MTAIPSVIWRQIDVNGSPLRLYLRGTTDLASWSSRKDDAHLFATKGAANQLIRSIRSRGATWGTEPAGPPCPTCGAPSQWVDTFWVCHACGDEFTDD